MLTPAIRASRTSAPPVIIWNAFATQVWLPPFVNLLPLADEMTTGLTLFGVMTVGACPKRDFGVAATTPATAVLRTKSRRLSLLIKLLRGNRVYPNYPIPPTTWLAIILRWASD